MLSSFAEVWQVLVEQGVKLDVKGVRGLRVVDGSVMPSLVTVNPCITTMMIGEKCADLIKAER